MILGVSQAFSGSSGNISISLSVLANVSLAGTGSSSSSLFSNLTVSGFISSDVFTGSFQNSAGNLIGVFKATAKDANTLVGTYSYIYSGNRRN